MRRDEFTYDLPEDLIAQAPPARRGESRLLCLNRSTGALADRLFADLLELLRPGDLLVFNDTRVLPARLFGHKPTGGKVEIMTERVLSDRQILAQMRFNKPPRPGMEIQLENGQVLRLVGERNGMYILEVEAGSKVMDVLNTAGHMPLPPYIKRADASSDRERYQTVYAKRPGAVAAPTAGLHFTEKLLKDIEQKGIGTAFVTLHVGAGTFQPVRTDNIEDHKMHSEYLEVSAEVCKQVRETRTHGGRVIAVGTTSVRSLETAGRSSELQPYAGETDIFIYPGYQFRVVDALITNFHLPESTLLMLVCAFAGRDNVLNVYRHAVTEKYRFFSYGDAMFIA